jgi:hypothetical protein
VIDSGSKGATERLLKDFSKLKKMDPKDIVERLIVEDDHNRVLKLLLCLIVFTNGR